MGLFDGQGVLHALEDLLAKEKALILSGDIDGVGRLTHEKLRLFKRLSRFRSKRSELEKLRYLAERNNQLLGSAARGFQAVQEQLRGLEKPPVGLKTYGRDGARGDIGTRPSDFNKRA